MTNKDAMKLALDALQFALHVGFDESSESQIKKGDKAGQQHRQAITALKERLAQEKALQTLHEENERLGLYRDAYGQPEQEPVGYVYSELGVKSAAIQRNLPNGTPLYTHPPQRIEPPAWFPAVENILNEYGLQAIDFVADFKAAMKDAEQPQRTERNFCPLCGKRTNDIHTCTPPQENT
jgi:hypothetical protein